MVDKLQENPNQTDVKNRVCGFYMFLRENRKGQYVASKFLTTVSTFVTPRTYKKHVYPYFLLTSYPIQIQTMCVSNLCC